MKYLRALSLEIYKWNQPMSKCWGCAWIEWIVSGMVNWCWPFGQTIYYTLITEYTEENGVHIPSPNQNAPKNFLHLLKLRQSIRYKSKIYLLNDVGSVSVDVERFCFVFSPYLSLSLSLYFHVCRHVCLHMLNQLHLFLNSNGWPQTHCLLLYV